MLNWLKGFAATCRLLYPCCLWRFLPRTHLTCVHVELNHFASTVLRCSVTLVSSQTDRSPVTRSPFFLVPATLHSCIVKQLSELASGRFTQIWRERQSHRHTKRWKQLECLPTVLLLEVPVPVDRVFIKALLQNGGDVGRPWPRGTLTITPFLFSCFFFFSLAEILHALPYVLSGCHDGLS